MRYDHDFNKWLGPLHRATGKSHPVRRTGGLWRNVHLDLPGRAWSELGLVINLVGLFYNWVFFN